MQFSQIWSQIGNLTSSLATSNDQLYANMAYHDINSACRWSWLESKGSITLVAGQKTYSLLGTSPTVTDCDGVYDVELVMTTSGSANRLMYAPPQFFSRAFSHCFTNSQPCAWSILGGTAATTSAAVVQGGQQVLALSHPPTNVAGQGVSLNVYYWRSAASIEMSAATDIPILPNQYHRLIVTRGCAIAMEQNQMFQEAAGYERAFQEQLARAMDADMANRFSDFEQMEIRPVVQTPAQAPVTQATYNPGNRKYPAAV